MHGLTGQGLWHLVVWLAGSLWPLPPDMQPWVQLKTTKIEVPTWLLSPDYGKTQPEGLGFIWNRLRSNNIGLRESWPVSIPLFIQFTLNSSKFESWPIKIVSVTQKWVPDHCLGTNLFKHGSEQHLESIAHIITDGCMLIKMPYIALRDRIVDICCLMQ